MSIPVLNQAYDEMRRLAIAGSVVAGGDFRLKKLIAPLEQLGAKAPVFAKVAEATKKVVDGKEKDSAEALLELATLVNAILYTQGETGLAGALQPIETTELFMPTTQASARVLKPLLEALTTTGSGRLELIKDAHERGAFRDLRLVKPALQALDDGYAEVADFITQKVLPLYGKAILPELRAKFDPSGRGGHPRRLKLMHALDGAGSRDIVKQALDSGSKEVRIVAIECLGGTEDLSYLLEQVTAKAQEVRQAAFQALAAMTDEAAHSTLRKALSGKDLPLAADAIRRARNEALLAHVVADAAAELAMLAKTKDKKEAGKKIVRLRTLVHCLEDWQDGKAEALLLSAFEQRGALAKIKGEPASGADLNEAVINALEQGSTQLRTVLAEANATLSADELRLSFQAARRALPPKAVFDMFSPYLSATDGKKKRDAASAKREVIREALGAHRMYLDGKARAANLDPRWLDVAVATQDVSLLRQLARPGHAGANAFLKKSFDQVIKKSSADDCINVVAGMVYAEHPEAIDALIAVTEKPSFKAQGPVITWFNQLIPDLPKSALPRLEALIEKQSEDDTEYLIDFIQKLRDRK